MNEVGTRLKKLSHLEKKVGGILVPSGSDFFYLTNSAASGWLFYDFSKPVIFTSEMDLPLAKKSWAKNIVAVKKKEEIFSEIICNDL